MLKNKKITEKIINLVRKKEHETIKTDGFNGNFYKTYSTV